MVTLTLAVELPLPTPAVVYPAPSSLSIRKDKQGSSSCRISAGKHLAASHFYQGIQARCSSYERYDASRWNGCADPYHKEMG